MRTDHYFTVECSRATTTDSDREMPVDEKRIQNLVARPNEALNVEVKNWIDPTQPEGQSKIVRAVLALRNRGGGELIIGFNNKTMEPEPNAPADVRITYHADAIQGLVSRFAHDPFEIEIGYGERGGQLFPVVVVPPGVRIPVASKVDLHSNGKTLIKRGAVFFRSLHANGVVSSTEARPEDWRDVMEICFNNREADFGAFFRRQLSGVTPDILGELVAQLRGIEPSPPPVTPCERARLYLNDAEVRYFKTAVDDRAAKSPGFDTSFLAAGAWNVALFVAGDFPKQVANSSFLNRIATSNPNYTGWPVWLDSRTFETPEHRPYVRDKAWEAFIISTTFFHHVDFWRIDPSGYFYLRRTLEDDYQAARKIEPNKYLDPTLVVYRVAEVIAVGLAFAKALGCAPDRTKLAFAFRWTKLARRIIASWANPMRLTIGQFMARDDEAASCVEVPLETAPTAIAPYVDQATRDLFLQFDGFEMADQVKEHVVSRLLERRDP